MANGELRQDNPLEKVPALVTDDGTTLYDSFVICSYLDGLADSPALIPAEQAAKIDVLRRHALADGIIEAAVACVGEMRRPQDKQFADAMERQKGKVTRAIDALEGEVAAMGNTLDLSTITVGCALDYVDFRLKDTDWRNGHPKLASLVQDFLRAPVDGGTAPKDPT